MFFDFFKHVLDFWVILKLLGVFRNSGGAWAWEAAVAFDRKGVVSGGFRHPPMFGAFLSEVAGLASTSSIGVILSTIPHTPSPVFQYNFLI